MSGPRRLAVVFGDQLDKDSQALRALDPKADTVLMMEVASESSDVPSHKQRTVLFLAALRHFAQDLRKRGFQVRYVTLDDPDNTQCFRGEIERACADLRPDVVEVVRPGEWRVLEVVQSCRDRLRADVNVHEDDHFYLTPDEFDAWADGRRQLVLEHFYRMMRRRFGVLLDEDGEPVGGEWNFDKSNRSPFRGDAGEIPDARRFRPDDTTKRVIQMLNERLPDLPGRIESFHWPVTRREALTALRAFIKHRLPNFGRYQDAIVEGKPFMYHSLISAALNLKLLNPREVVGKAVAAYEAGDAPIESVEGFVRQIIGWREFIRGVYWHEGPDYRDRNALSESLPLPQLYWSGDSEMRCLADAVNNVLEYGYAHHIQRLMTLGNFAMVLGVKPGEINDWFLGMFVDAVDWVTTPNVVGMATHADGGIVGTKPYAAGGAYINRMSDHCKGCRFDPRKRTGEDACPFTTLYWDFLMRHEKRFRENTRMGLAMKNLENIESRERQAIQRRADDVRRKLAT